MSDLRIVKLLDPINNTIISGGLVPKGTYNTSTNYAVGDSVDFNGSSYIMYNDAGPGTAPTNTTYWQILANKGDTGAPGAGVPFGGSTGQALIKNSGTDYDTSWYSLTASDVGADPAGSAALALSTANAYTDGKSIVAVSPIVATGTVGTGITISANASTTDIPLYLAQRDSQGAFSVGGLTLDTAAAPTSVIGMFKWNHNRQTYDVQLNSQVTLQGGQELVVYVRNTTNTTLTNGTTVMATGVHSDVVAVAPAINNGTVDPRLFVAVLTQDIPKNTEGLATWFGELNDMNTSAWEPFTELYIGVNGQFTATQPNAPAHRTPIAIVTRQHPTHGTIFIRFNNGSALGETDSNVQFATPTKGDLIAYDTGVWQNLHVGTNGQALLADSAQPLGMKWDNLDHTQLLNVGTHTHSQIDTHINSTSNPHSVTKTQVGLSDVTNDAQVKRSEMGVNSGVATLDSNGKVPITQVPAIAIVDTFVVNSQAAMLSLTSANHGDMAVRTDINKTFILAGTDYSQLSDWQELLTPTGSVASVNGKTGVVVIGKSDVGLGNVPNVDSTNPANISQDSTHRFVTDTEKSTWSGKQDALGFTPEDSSNKSSDTSLGDSDILYPTQNAVKSYVDNHSGASTWGSITGDITNQTDLQSSLDAKANLSGATFTGRVVVDKTSDYELIYTNKYDYTNSQEAWRTAVDPDGVGLNLVGHHPVNTNVIFNLSGLHFSRIVRFPWDTIVDYQVRTLTDYGQPPALILDSNCISADGNSVFFVGSNGLLPISLQYVNEYPLVTDGIVGVDANGRYVASDGRYVYVGLWKGYVYPTGFPPATLLVYDAIAMWNVVKIAELTLPFNMFQGVKLIGSTLVISTGDTITNFDVSDPSNPIQRDAYGLESVQGFTVDGNYIFVQSTLNYSIPKVAVLSIANPSSTQLVKNLDLSDTGDVQWSPYSKPVYLNGDLFVSTWGNNYVYSDILGNTVRYSHTTGQIIDGAYDEIYISDLSGYKVGSYLLQNGIPSIETPGDIKGRNLSGVNTGDQDLSAYESHLTNFDNPHNTTAEQVGLGNVTNDSQVKRSEMGVASGVATLDTNGLVPSTQLPSYVDDVLEFADLAHFPAIGQTRIIYVALDTNKTYRWSGSAYIYITSGAVDSVNGKTGVVLLSKADIGLGNVTNVAQEPTLGNPTADGYVLASTTDGVRSWVVPPNTSQWTTTGNNIYYTTGQVMIGTTTPAAQLTVNSAVNGDTGIMLSNTYSSFSAAAVYKMKTSTSEWHFGLGGGSRTDAIKNNWYVLEAGVFRFLLKNTSGDFGLGGSFTDSSYTGATMVGKSGSVGIGTTNPISRLDIQGVGTTTDITLSTKNNIGATKFVVLDNGNVGINTTSPAEKLDVNGTAQMTGFKLTTSPTNGYVLTSDANGVGTWQASTGGGGTGAFDGGSANSTFLIDQIIDGGNA